MKKVVIIGSGLGGLSCGVILAKNGYDVTVLEQAAQIGGCLQCFSRKGARFETGMHFIGSAAKGQTLHRLMNYLEMTDDVQLMQLDPNGYDVGSLQGQQFRFANGREAFIEQMVGYFPRQRDNLERYFDLVERVANASSLHSLKYAETDSMMDTEFQLRTVNEVIETIVDDPLLAKVLVGNLPLYAARRDKTPFSTHAFIMDFYNQSAFRIVGGSDRMALSMRRTIERYGGRVYTGCKATRIVCDDTHATGVEVNGEQLLQADIVISDAHPVRTLELLGETHLIRPAFRQRVNNMPQSIGGFSVYLKFKPNRVRYINNNFYAYAGDTPWGCEDYDETSWPKGFLYMHFCPEGALSKGADEGLYASTGVVLSYMHMEDVERWEGTRVGHRGTDYEAFKRLKAERLIDALEQHFPGIRNDIESYYTSTPLTYLDYTGTARGSMYGVAKDVALGAAGRISHRTRVSNVLLTGQNINSHGMLGVMVGTIVTCSELLTAKTIYEQIMKNK